MPSNYVKTTTAPNKSVVYGCGGGAYGKIKSALKPSINHDVPLKKGKKR
jgi:hypothetical protein